MHKRCFAFILVLAPAAAAAQARPAPDSAQARPAAAQVGFSTGLDHQKGRYGTDQSIETSAIRSAVAVRTGRVQLSASLPYLRIDAPGNVVAGGGGGRGFFGLPVIDPARPSERTVRQGLGDLRLGADYGVPVKGFGMTLSGQVKVPTANAAKGLGTGKPDYSVAAELSKTLGAITPFAALGYTVTGDPEGFDLADGLSARAGAAVQLGSRVSGHLGYAYAQSLGPLLPDEQQLAGGLDAELSRAVGVGLYGSAGLSSGAPDLGLGVALRLRSR